MLFGRRVDTLTFQNYTRVSHGGPSSPRAYLVDHITLRMPALILHVAIDFDKLLEDCTITPRALGGKPSRVMEVAIDIVLMLII
jgi:hypothetical protein